ncbi:MAG: GAF domain-containing protein, partial [Geobacteraceae bacterium]|nr:GAF domain-containing protein [Geobacteraceae bacterium]
LESSLTKLNDRNELKLLHAVVASMATIRTEIYSANGIVTTLKKKLTAIEQANRSADKLHDIVVRQTTKGKESISLARSQQETSIATVNTMVRRSLSQIVGIGFTAIGIGIFFGLRMYHSLLLPLRVVVEAVRSQQEQGREKASLAEAVAGGDLGREVIVGRTVEIDPAQIRNDEMGMVLNAIVGMSEAQVTLDRALAGMTASLRTSRDEETRRDHLKSGLYELNKILRDELDTAVLANEALAFLTGFLGAGVGILYLYDEKREMLQTLSTYAVSSSTRLNDGFRLGEGLAGQVALERKAICLDTVPPKYLPIVSALGEADPLNIAILPIQHNDTLIGVVEIGSFRKFNADDFEFLTQALEGIAIAVNVNRSRQLVDELLEQTQAQAEELRIQREELQQSNEELEERARMLAEQRKNKFSVTTVEMT